MFPVFLLVFAVLTLVVAEGLPRDAFPFPDPGGWAILYTAVAALVPLVAGDLEVRRLRGRLASPTATWDALARTAGRSRLRLRLLVMLVWLAILFGARWGDFVNRSFLAGWILVDEILLLLPFLVAILGIWIHDHRITTTIQAAEGSLRSSVVFRLRMMGMPLVPLAAIAIGKDVVVWVGLEGQFLVFDYLSWAVLLVFVAALFFLSPFLIRAILGTRPLPRGEIRERVEALSVRWGFRYRDILVWNTGKKVLNAAIVGLTPRTRYVLLTDLLLDRLPPDEIEAVFCHEAAHGLDRHATLYMLFSLTFILLSLPLATALPPDSILLAGAALASVFGIYWFVLFGFVSRRAEREADLHGARMVGDPERLVGALERISFLTGERKGWFAWRHYSTSRRIEILRRFADRPSLLVRARRNRRILLGGTIAALAVAGLFALREIPLQHARGKVRLALYREDLAAMERSAEQGSKRYPDDPWFVFMRGYAAAGRDRREEAMRAYRRALELAPNDDLAASILEELRDLEAAP
jgi:Zn-dependent protease with chaperone function